MTDPAEGDLTRSTAGAVPQPEPDRDRQSTLEAAAQPSNTPVDDGPDPTTADRADPALRGHGPRDR